jgi:3-deoxy-manno-octulosonate cytidylyltransferase (CMP-KDO synthetase)
VVVATCDREIASVIEGYGGKVVLTSPSHPGATDRVAEAAQQVQCTHVVNVQGDEILVVPEYLDLMVRAMAQEPEMPAWNAVARLARAEDLDEPSIVKCAVSLSGRILFCARRFASSPRVDGFGSVRVVLGLLGYRRDFLARYGALAHTPWEAAEAIDQSRIVEHDIALKGVELPTGYPGINEPRDVAIVERILDTDPAQQRLLHRILSAEPPGRLS